MELGITLEQVVDVVKRASSLMLTDHFEITSKSGGYENIVTSSDVAVQKFLCKELSELLPGSGFYCEEEDFITVGSSLVWIIDPIDGTANYSRGIPNCAISVALVSDGVAQMGVVYSPSAGELFTAEKGKGAFFNGRQIKVSDRPFANALFCTAFSLYRRQYADICIRFMQKVYDRCNDFRRFGVASLELCYVAMGRCDMYFEYCLSPWDYAAASLVLMEAGGCLAGESGSQLVYDRNTMVFAANTAENLDELVSIFKTL